MKIDNEFHNIIPPITEDEKKQLRQSIEVEGIRDALVVWGDILIDGHNRYEIAQELGIKYKTTNKDFASRSLAKEWIIKNQFGRRNLSPYQRGKLALKLKDEIAGRAKERQKEHGKTAPGRKTLEHNCAQVNRKDQTRDELARIAGVCHTTISRVSVIEEFADEETKKMLNNDEITLNAAYRKTKGLNKEGKRGRGRQTRNYYLTEKRLSFLKEKLEKIKKMLDVKSNSLCPVSVIRFELNSVIDEVNKLQPYHQHKYKTKGEKND